MGTRALPDMYALSPRACNPWASGIHIRQSTRTYVITYTYQAKHPKYTTEERHNWLDKARSIQPTKFVSLSKLI